MSNLTDNLPPESLREIYETQIQPGAVFFLYDEFAQKEKYIVVLGIDTDAFFIGTRFINSEVNQNVIKSLEAKGLQFKIKASDYDFLHHDSYINASKIDRRKHSVFLDILIARNGTYIDQIKLRDFDYLRSLMSNSRLISTVDKRNFGLL